MLITDLTTKTPSLSDYILGAPASAEYYKATIATLGTLLAESYTGSTLAGAKQSPKAAIDSLNAKIEELSAYIKSENSWDAFRRHISMGYGPTLYPVGTEISVPCVSGAPYSSIVFRVIGHNHDKNPADESANTITLMMKYAINGMQFDAVEALYYAESGLAAGTYCFTLPNWDASYGGNATYNFTLSQSVQAGGQIVFNWGYNVQASTCKISTYSSAESSTAIETVSVSTGSSGTSLGTADGSVANMNHIQRARYGSNNYMHSAVRQWANSGLTPFGWKPQTKFDRPPSYLSKAGFVTYLDPEFVDIVGATRHLNRTNTVYDEMGITTAYTSDEKFFLLSNEEYGFSTESGINTGSVYEFYDGATDTDRITYDISSNSSARYVWMRTPFPSTAHNERFVDASGALSSYNASYGYAVALACTIY
jgi:hypothetical protein